MNESASSNTSGIEIEKEDSGMTTATHPRIDNSTADTVRGAKRARVADLGFTLTEMLVAITLMGVAGVSVLGAMAVSAKGSAVNASQAAAVVWLQGGIDYLAKVPFSSCTTGQESAVGTAYQTNLQSSGAPVSQQGWPQQNITVVQPVLFWNGTQFSSTCTPSGKLQQITIRVVNGTGNYSSTVTMVKSNG